MAAATFIDITGQRFGRLSVLTRAENNARGDARWLCQCDCGAEKVIMAQSLRSGATVSCGCFSLERPRARKHGAAGTNAYSAWSGMVQRCTNPRNSKWHRYGGRGVTACERWKTYENFLADMGERPPGMTVDRRDNDGNYEPGNCRWATQKTQAGNRENNVMVIVAGEAMTASNASRLLGPNRSTVSRRIRDGWPAKKAAIAPLNSRRTE